MKNIFFYILLIVFWVSPLCPSTTLAKENIEKYRYQCWNLYITTADGVKECFLVSAPVLNAGDYNKRDDAYLWIRHITKDIDEVSLTPGYKFPADGAAEMRIYQTLPGCFQNKDVVRCSVTQSAEDDNQAALLGQNCREMLKGASQGKCTTLIRGTQSDYYRFSIAEDEQAWVKDSELDGVIVEKMAKGSYAVVTARSGKNTCSTDLYSLIGFKDAYQKMKSLCGRRQ